MKRKNHKLYVEDILEAVDKVERYTRGLTYEAFAKNDMAADAVIRNLEIIGEASRNIPGDIRQKFPDIPWKRMIRLRNYFERHPARRARYPFTSIRDGV